jgi:hypothetical protein
VYPDRYPWYQNFNCQGRSHGVPEGNQKVPGTSRWKGCSPQEGAESWSSENKTEETFYITFCHSGDDVLPETNG